AGFSSSTGLITKQHARKSRGLPCEHFNEAECSKSSTARPQQSDSAGCSKRSTNEAAGESQPEAYPLGYVEGCDDPRTKLGTFFSSLLDGDVASAIIRHPRLMG